MATYRFTPTHYHLAIGAHEPVLRIAPGDPAAAQRLAAAGFVGGQGGYRLSVEGSF